jgi:cardiolipin synthase
LVRVLLTPFVVRAILLGEMRSALALCLIAGFTDLFDGYVARRMHSASRLGAYLDPVADKVLLGATYIALGIVTWIPWWLVVIVFSRDVLILAMVAGGFLFTKVRDYPPSMWGKLSTALQIAAVVVALTNANHGNRDWAWWTTAGMTAWSGLHYAWRGIQILRSRTT